MLQSNENPVNAAKFGKVQEPNEFLIESGRVGISLQIINFIGMKLLPISTVQMYDMLLTIGRFENQEVECKIASYYYLFS